MKNENKNQILTRFLVALIVVMLTAPTLFAKADSGKKMKPDALAKKTKQPKLTKEKIDNILDRMEQFRPERAKELRKLRKADPKKFRSELKKIMQKWASKKARKPEGLSRRGKGKGKSFAHDKFKDSHRNSRWAQSQHCPFDRADAGASSYPQFKGRQHRRQKMFYNDYQPGRQRDHGRRDRGRGQGFRGQSHRQPMGFSHGRRSRGQRHNQEMGFGYGRGRRFNRAREYGRREHGYNSGSRRWRNHHQW